LSRLIVTKAEFQELAEQRLAEAKALLDQGQWDGAYYLAGYAVELALERLTNGWLTGCGSQVVGWRRAAIHRGEGPPECRGDRWAFATLSHRSAPSYQFSTPSRTVSNPLVNRSRPRRRPFTQPLSTPYMEYSHG